MPVFRNILLAAENVRDVMLTKNFEALRLSSSSSQMQAPVTPAVMSRKAPPGAPRRPQNTMHHAIPIAGKFIRCLFPNDPVSLLSLDAGRKMDALVIEAIFNPKQDLVSVARRIGALYFHELLLSVKTSKSLDRNDLLPLVYKDYSERTKDLVSAKLTELDTHVRERFRQLFCRCLHWELPLQDFTLFQWQYKLRQNTGFSHDELAFFRLPPVTSMSLVIDHICAHFGLVPPAPNSRPFSEWFI